MGSCEILGGAFGPKIAGTLADGYGLSAALWMMFGLALAGGIFGMFLRETAPSQRHKAPTWRRDAVQRLTFRGARPAMSAPSRSARSFFQVTAGSILP